MKILIVDDFKTVRKITTKLLNTLKITEIDEAESGNEALEKINKNDYDLILSDCYMPNMTGIELVDIIRKNYSKEQLPFVLVTSEEKESVLSQAKNCGINDYLLKPFSKDVLWYKVSKYM